MSSSLTNHSPVAIAAVRSKAGPAAADLDDPFVDKFLSARGGAVDKAAQMLTAHLEWRAQNSVDTVMQEYFGATSSRPDIHELYSAGFYGNDRAGNPVYVERPGKSNVAEAFAKLGEPFMVRWHICTMETGRDLYRTKKAQGVVTVIDATGIGMGHISKAALSFFRKVSAMDQDNYPEHLVTSIIINAGMIAKNGWKMLSPFMDTRTKAKFHILGSDYHETLHSLVPKESLPAFLGGTRADGDCLRIFGAAAP
uniref:CRAL-TRIO domain-containing protein n=1 Tax=Eutreptiella gymnastica TaxID=73025 RepID=A0A7S1JE89_9EUGL